MDTLEKFRMDETRRLIRWIKENKSSWLDITTCILEQDAAVAQEFKDVIRELRDHGFYQFIVLLLYTNNLKMENAIEHSLLSLAEEYWSEELPNKIINLLLDNLVNDRFEK